MSNSAKRWYVLYTKKGAEKKVSNLLSRKKIENYCPLKRQWHGRRKNTLEPLFDSYVFVQIEEKDIMNIRTTDSVVNLVYWLGNPAVIREEEIDLMKRFMNEYANVTLEKIPFSAEDMVRIAGGPVSDVKTHMISVKANTVKIALPSLGYMMLAEVEKPAVELISAEKQSYNIGEKYQFAV